MTHPIATSLPYGIDPVYVVAAVAVLALALTGWSIRYNRNRLSGRRVGTPAVWVAALAALNCTVYSADTSWRFAADYLDMAGTFERAMMFSAAELALFATALMARQNLKSQGAPGLPGVLVWVITGVQIIPAYAESGTVGGTVRAFVGPVMAAVLWHLTMGIELRLHKPDAASQGLLATLGREGRERLLSRLGVATRSRDAAQITKDRATRRAVAHASRLSGMSKAEREADTKVTRRLQTALTRAEVGTDPQQRQAFLDQLAARRHAAALATVDLPSPWIHSARNRDVDREVRSPLAPSPADKKQVDRRQSTVPNDGPDSRGDGDRAEPGTGTATDGDRPHTVPNHNGDREHPDTGTGTATKGDRPHTVPVRRKTKAKAQRSRPGAGKSKPPRRKQLSLEETAELVRPQIPALLERDGNAVLTRPQLREILRTLNLAGGRNENITRLLQLLRDEAGTTATGSPTR